METQRAAVGFRAATLGDRIYTATTTSPDQAEHWSGEAR
jgi:hypothetical protein